MADQRIFFEQGSSTTGDSGERGDSTAVGGGVDSVKPIADGERAAQSIFRRPTENMRQRTERLRDAGEESKYLIDSGMRWILAGGQATGLSAAPEPMPGITGWNPVTGAFVATAPMVVQPITTPSGDIQEDAIYGFPYAAPTPPAERVTFNPIEIGDPATDVDALTNKRAYNGANLIKIVWESKSAAELAGATVPGFCDAVLSGDPVHILTISILDTGATQLAQLDTALAALATRTTGTAGLIGDIGLEYTIGGSTAQAMSIADITSDSKGADYRMVGTFEREIHYIPTATFVDFFAAPNSLADGDTLAIHFADYATDAAAADPLTGRRERVPSNISSTYPNSTTVLAADLFITSDAVDVYKIPLCIPICKRIGDDLYWLDGTVITGTQSGEPVYMGEHGYTVNRVAAFSSGIAGQGSGLVGKSLHTDPGGSDWSSQAFWYAAPSTVEVWLDDILDAVNNKPSIDNAEVITGTREHRAFVVFNEAIAQSAIKYNVSPYELAVNTTVMAAANTLDGGGSSKAHVTRHTDLYTLTPYDAQRHNRLMQGFKAQSQAANYTTGDADFGKITPNVAVFSPGAAYVGGSLIIQEELTLSDVWNSVATEGGLTAEAKTVLALPPGGEYNCKYLYCWLRIDGTIWLEPWGPDILSGNESTWRDHTTICQHRPMTLSGLPQGSFSIDDYTLVDVVWVTQGNDDSTAGADEDKLRIGVTFEMGGGLNILESAAFYTGAVWETIAPYFLGMDSLSGAAGATALESYSNGVTGSPSAGRTPGVPVGVTRLGFINARLNCTIGGGTDRVTVRIGDREAAESAHACDNSIMSVGVYTGSPSARLPAPLYLATVDSMTANYIPCAEAACPVFAGYTAGSGAGSIPRSYLNYEWEQTGTANGYLSLGCRGFYWDRYGTPANLAAYQLTYVGP